MEAEALPSLFRLVGVSGGLLALLYLFRRRSERLLTRGELVLALGLVGVVLGGLFPGLYSILTDLTGFRGELGRITSVLAFATVFLLGMVVQLQARVEELNRRFYELLKRSAVQGALAGVEQTSTPLLLVMPALNEADNLKLLLPAAPREVLGLPTRVLVVDDGSSDGTAEVARSLGALVVQNPINVGGGHALKVGFLAAQQLGSRFIVTLDADGQHRFEDLAVVVAPLLEERADLVIGSRQLGQSVGHETFRAVGLQLFNRVLTFLVGQPVTDCSSGMRGLRVSVLPKLKLVQLRHHTAEMIIEASRRGLRRVEVPITILPRVLGESKKGTNWRYGVRFANTILSSWWRSG